VLLLLWGAKERFSQVPLAAIYVPGFLILFALACARFWQETRFRPANTDRIRRFVLCAGGIIFLHLAISGALVSDLGMALYALPVSLLLVIVVVQSLPQASLTQETYAWIVAAGVPFLAAALFLAAPRLSIGTAEAFLEKDILSEKLRDPDAIVTDKNLLRLLQWVDRKKLDDTGTEASEAISQHLMVMDDYTTRGVCGEGYMKVPVIPSVREVSMSDNVAAIYLLAQFGALGVAGLAAAWALLATAAREMPEASGEGEGLIWRRFGWCLAALCGVTIAFVSLYMVAANCQLAPFTGRNVYLLGLGSLGDVWESCILLALCSTGLVISRPRNL
jgi:hypothetical protein